MLAGLFVFLHGGGWDGTEGMGFTSLIAILVVYLWLSARGCFSTPDCFFLKDMYIMVPSRGCIRRKFDVEILISRQMDGWHHNCGVILFWNVRWR